MPAFDPDKYLAEKTGTSAKTGATGGFDPDKYLAEKTGGASLAEGPSELEAGLRGAAQGATFGFADELTGGGEALLDKLRGKEGELGDLYRKHRDESRANYEAAQKEHPGAYLAGNIGGALAPGLLTGGGSLVGEGAGLGARMAAGALAGSGQGALYGLGTSNADVTKGDVGGALEDTLNGGALGAGIGAAGGALSAGASKLKALANAKVQGGLDRAQELAEKAADKQQSSLRGVAGASTQKGSRLVENLLRAEQTGELTPEQATALKGLRDSGDWKELVQGITQHNLEDLPGQLSQAKADRQAIQDFMANRGQQVASEAERLASPSEAARQIGDRLKRYLPRTAGAIAGKVLGTTEAPGLAEGQVLGPAVHALKRMVGHPSVVVPAFRGLGKVASIAATEPMRLGKFGPVLSRALDRGDDSFATAHFLLSQNNPEYQETLQRMHEEGGP